jgi:transposase
VVSRARVYNVSNRYRSQGYPAAIQEKARSGAPAKVDGQLRAQIMALACSTVPEGHARWTLRLLADSVVELAWIDQMSHTTIRDILNLLLLEKLGWRWHRFRKRLKYKQDPEQYALKEAQLMNWLQLGAKQPHLEVGFADESGFSLTPCVPYRWQAPGERYCLPSQRSATQSIFGLLSQHNQLWTYWAQKTITS